MNSGLRNHQQRSTTQPFIREVAKYFMDFLETDFHKRRLPKRRIILRNNDNLLVGIDLRKYPRFAGQIFDRIAGVFAKDAVVTRGAHKTAIPKRLLDLVNLRLERISDERTDMVISAIAPELEDAAALHDSSYDTALTVAMDQTSQIVRQELVSPMIKHIERPILDLNLGDENNLFLLEDELTDNLVRSMREKIAQIVQKLHVGEKIDVEKELAQSFTTKTIRQELKDFFEGFRFMDLASELEELFRNKRILDKQEFYLYFGEITHDRTKYPIFYIPFEIDKTAGSLSLVFDSQLYVNKKALEFIAQRYNEETGKKGRLQTPIERIIYLSTVSGELEDVLARVTSELRDFFDLEFAIDFSNAEPQTARSLHVRVSNGMYIALFDKSDEALINDYEDMLVMIDKAADHGTSDLFENLIGDFIFEEPTTFEPVVADEWDALETVEKLVFQAPCPLNEEQRKILDALEKEGCKYVTVEGPPGTGKSHTITAAVFNAILQNRSVLVLSDKKEALDVVEDKITATMNQVRVDKKFQNPVLRLGRTGNTYSKILSTGSIEGIKNHYRAVKKGADKLEKDIATSLESQKSDLEAEISLHEQIDETELVELLKLEEHYHDHTIEVDIHEVSGYPNAASEIERFRKTLLTLVDKLGNGGAGHRLLRLGGMTPSDIRDLDGLISFTNLLGNLVTLARHARDEFGKTISLITLLGGLSKTQLAQLPKLIKRYVALRHPITGYISKGEKLKAINNTFHTIFPQSPLAKPHRKLKRLTQCLVPLNYIQRRVTQVNKGSIVGLDCLSLVYALLTDGSAMNACKEMIKVKDEVLYLRKNAEDYSSTMDIIGFETDSIETIFSNKLVSIQQSDFDCLIRMIDLHTKVSSKFKNLPQSDFFRSRNEAEKLQAMKMTHLMDGRLIDFYQESRATAKALRQIIRNKEKFPRREFSKLKEAFPCMLAGIRDYAEYIPLEPDIFDLVIIDEASQVSIAQALPAVTRAKKVLILGDKKQFSNVKAAHARSDINKSHLNNLKEVFVRSFGDNQTQLVKLEKFNIKTSVLEFFEFVTNHHIQLRKYFRGYREIISYSNRYFYDQLPLQVMKIRGKPIDDVLKFSYVKHDGIQEVRQNTNVPEIEFIIEQLGEMKKRGSTQSVGIITPHTNQQRLVIDSLGRLPDKDYFFDDLRLKVMTFDTCQGEERDIVFYSMVATRENDRLWGVFIKDLGTVDLEEDGQIKAQRLNVGFSRAKECMHFVVSKPLDEFTGSVREALLHYQQVYEEARKEKGPETVDSRSHMEPQVLNWLYQTKTWRGLNEQLDLQPQFPIGDYLRQLDAHYTHPRYVVDFLLTFRADDGTERKIIIEYDGFAEHFQEAGSIDEHNYADYHSEDDIFRQKVLEGYGYRFLRLNRFNVGSDPISTIDTRLQGLLSNRPVDETQLQRVHELVEAQEQGQMRQCPKCKKLKSATDFMDPALETGVGRICLTCKDAQQRRPRVAVKTRPKKKHEEKETVGKVKRNRCPKCGSRMKLRTGRYGKFYGCRKFPHCRGTRPHS